MRMWMLAVVAAIGLLILGLAARAETGVVTWSTVFRMPPAEAVGAALGAAVAVNVALAVRRRRRRGGWGE